MKMQAMTQRERVENVLARKPVDRLPWADSPWPETVRRWVGEGHMTEGEDVRGHFGMAVRCAGWIKSVAKLDFQDVVIEETEDTILALDGNGAKLRRHKKHASTPEHVDFTVQDNDTWREHARPLLLDFDRRRIPFESYREQKKIAAGRNEFFVWSGVAPFEQMHPVCGHEYMLMGMAEDPDWVRDMVEVYSDLTVRHLEVLFAEEGKPDGIWFYEDMGFKERPFMSPAMYREIVQPGHKKLFDYAHSLGLKVVVHSCGFVEPLVPGLIEAGMDCLQAMEVKAGMDMPRLFEKFGDRISFCGNIDVRTLCANDRRRIDEELKKKILPVTAHGGGYILHSDHSIPPEVDYDTLKYFFAEGSKLTGR